MPAEDAKNISWINADSYSTSITVAKLLFTFVNKYKMSKLKGIFISTFHFSHPLTLWEKV